MTNREIIVEYKVGNFQAQEKKKRGWRKIDLS